MKVYLDTSAILRRLWGAPGALADWGDWDEAYTSELTRVEAHRVIDRQRLRGELDDPQVARSFQALEEILDSVGIIRLRSEVLEIASRSFPVVLRTLDAIHLASAVLFREEKGQPLVLLTHDAQLGLAAQSLGFSARGFTLP